MTQAFVTVVVPFMAVREAQVNKYLDTLGNAAGEGASANPPRPEVLSAAQLKKLREFVHFMSILVVPEDGGLSAFLMIELCADGHSGKALERVADAIPEVLCRVIGATGNEAPRTQAALHSYLREHRVEGATGVLSRTLELDFEGTPGMTVSRIQEEADLAAWIRDRLDEDKSTDPALTKLERLRGLAFKDVCYKWAFVSEPVRLLDDPKPKFDLAKALLRAAWRDFLWPLIPLPLAFGLGSYFWLGHSSDRAIWILVLVLGIELLIAAFALKFAYDWLRRQEENDVPFDVEPEQDRMREILGRENQPGVAQNHLFSLSILKLGRVRRTSLRIALWLVGELSRGRSRPGHLDKIGSIHFARWILLPGTDRLVFLSNYDGSWQSYLEDFIARLREGLTSIWSNTRDFPKTANLITGGVADGARFKRWARRQQQPTRFWCCAYPQLTTERIRTHAAIRHGFASVSNESQAAKWLALFGYAEPESIEKEEISALVFGGLPFFRFGQCLILEFGADKAKARQWLKSVERDLSYGENAKLTKVALVVAFSRSGLVKLGLDDAAIATFPTAFQQGMHDSSRARGLGDEDPQAWWWGGAGQVDGVLVVYARDQAALSTEIDQRKAQFENYGHLPPGEVCLRELSAARKEPFGFKDGISQPIMRGSKHWSDVENTIHVVEPGELLLGYRDNFGNLNPSPSHHGQDLGRNGTFLVVRQLEQHVDAFKNYVEAEVKRLAADPRAPDLAGADLEHWVAARMMGRWRNGLSLVRNPLPPPSGPGAASPDNEFQYGLEDPDGLRCPLGAHIRRANPRDSLEPGSQMQLAISNRHRILRVGRVYQPDNGKDPGLLFMCINADIERQFEFLQQTWLLGSNFHGLDDEIDPVVGYRGNGDSMTVPTPRGPLRMKGLARFVTTRGGGYFFVPGRSAIRVLTS